MKTIKSRLAVLALLLATLGVVTASGESASASKDITWGRTAAPAEPQGRDITWGKVRKTWGTDVTHSANDSGYTAAIKVRCNTGKIVYLSKGERTALSVDSADACTATGVDAIYVGANQAVRCGNNLPPYGWHYFVGTGWHAPPSWASLDCFMQRPI